MESQAINLDTLARQALVEHQTLEHVMEALRITLDWPVPRRDLAAKLSSVRFMAQSFQRHLERLMAIEETDGYMLSARDRQPHLSTRFEELRAEHDCFRQVFRQLVPSLEAVTSQDATLFDNLCHELRDLLGQVRDHSQAETALIQEAFFLEVGGES
jgi:hemerythrin-like domain-containing protein